MTLTRKKIFAIIGSASEGSSNERLVETIRSLTTEVLDITLYTKLKSLPHFDPYVAAHNPPAEVTELYNEIRSADGVLISTPEYIFSIPSGLKNAIEWCVSTTIFSAKPVGLITASASGDAGHRELQLIMKTLMATFTPETTLLIHGIKGKVDKDGRIIDEDTKEELMKFIDAFRLLIGFGSN